MKVNLEKLASMKYSGRGIAVGRTKPGQLFVGYTLTGRSSSSQSRELIEGPNTRTISTGATDPATLNEGSAALLLYPAIIPVNGKIVVSNGAQTNLLYSTLMNNPDFSPEEVITEAFKNPFFLYEPPTFDKDGKLKSGDRFIDITTYEPDAPNNTPRISAVLDTASGNVAFHSVIKFHTGQPSPLLWTSKLNHGEGYMITTYEGGNENPLKPYDNHPFAFEVGFPVSVANLCDVFFETIQRGAEPGDNYGVSSAVILNHADNSGMNIKTKNRFTKVYEQ